MTTTAHPTPRVPEQVAAYATMAALKGISAPQSNIPEGLMLAVIGTDHRGAFNLADCPYEVAALLRDWFGEIRAVRHVWSDAVWDMVEDHLVPVLPAPDASLRLREARMNPVLIQAPSGAAAVGAQVVVPWLTVLGYVLHALDAA